MISLCLWRGDLELEVVFENGGVVLHDVVVVGVVNTI